MVHYQTKTKQRLGFIAQAKERARMRLHYYRFDSTVPEAVQEEYGAADGIIDGVSISTAKKLLKQYGGNAWTQHIDRDGGCFEVTDITLKGNNSKFKYNHHL